MDTKTITLIVILLFIFLTISIFSLKKSADYDTRTTDDILKFHYIPTYPL